MKFSQFIGGSNQLDEFYIVLANCADINLFPPQSNHLIPPLPSNSQVVYLGTAISNQTWQQVQTTFTANNNYNMLWIFPKQYTDNIPQSSDDAGIDFAYPQLSPAGNILTISPSGPIIVCTPWEWAPTNTTLLTSSLSNTGQYQWYKDGQAISGATSQTHNAQHSQQGVNVRTHNYTVTNPASGCTSIPVIVNFVPTPLLPVEGVGNLSRGVWLTIRTTENLPISTYSWNIPGASINDINVNDPFVDVFFPISSPSPVAGSVIINGQAACANNTYSYEFYLFPNKSIRSRDIINEEINSQKITIAPNPV